MFRTLFRRVRAIPGPRPASLPHRPGEASPLRRAPAAPLAAILLVLALAAGPAEAAKVLAEGGIGAGGYDPVAYFTQEKAVQGAPDLTAEHAGVTYRFAVPEHRDLFTAAPEKYLPQYGGYCAYAAAKGALAPTDPEAFTVIDGKLYLNYSQDVRKRWLPRAGEYIEAADENWVRLGVE